jgi:hypothetical protein
VCLEWRGVACRSGAGGVRRRPPHYEGAKVKSAGVRAQAPAYLTHNSVGRSYCQTCGIGRSRTSHNVAPAPDVTHVVERGRGNRNKYVHVIAMSIHN